MHHRTLLVAVALVFAIGGVARAAELSTSLLYTGGTSFVCSITNVSSVPQAVRIRAYDTNGVVLLDTSLTLPPRGSQGFGVFGSGHCRFTTAAAKGLFRASIGVSDSFGRVISALPAQ
jgi:hypothetical protein